jgi:hypothetical protein
MPVMRLRAVNCADRLLRWQDDSTKVGDWCGCHRLGWRRADHCPSGGVGDLREVETAD